MRMAQQPQNGPFVNGLYIIIQDLINKIYISLSGDEEWEVCKHMCGMVVNN